LARITGEVVEEFDDVEEFELLPSRPNADPFGVVDGLKLRSRWRYSMLHHQQLMFDHQVKV